jgi:hypothetical protein
MESAIHTYVCEALRLYFLKHGIKAKRWISVGSDLMLAQKDSKKKLAIEVETGHQYRMDKEQLIRKFIHLSKYYDVVIILTNSFYLQRYKHLFPRIPILLRKNAMNYFSRRLTFLSYPAIRHVYYRSKKLLHSRLSLSELSYYGKEYGFTE